MLGTPDEDEQGKKKRKKEVNRLTEMIVSDVDIVDRPANRRPFLLFKREAGMPQEEKVGVTEGQDGQVIAVEVVDPESGSSQETGNATEASASAETENQDDAVAAADGGEAGKQEAEPIKKDEGDASAVKAMEEEEEEEAKKPEKEEEKEEDGDVEKAMIPKQVKTAVLAGLREGSERMMSLLAVLRAAKTTDEQVKTPLPNKVFSEVKAIQTLLAGLVQRYPSPATKEDGDGVEKAATAHQSLLSEKFAAVAKIGSEIAEAGETMDSADLNAKLDQLSNIAWSIREVAVVTQVTKSDEKEDAPDVGAIQDLLKQAGALTIPKQVRDAVVEKFRAQVEKILSIMKEIREMKETDEETKTPMPGKVSGAIKGVVNELGAIVQKYPSPASKHDSILFSLQKHFDGIKELVSQVLSSDAVARESAEDAQSETGNAADGEKADEVVKAETEEEPDRFAKMEKRMDEIVKMIEGKAPEDDPAIRDSNAADSDAVGEPVRKSERHAWPVDLAEHVREQEEAAKKKTDDDK